MYDNTNSLQMINSPEFDNYLGQIYPFELEIKDNEESRTHASYLDLQLLIWTNYHFHKYIYDKRDDFNFHITNLPFLNTNVPSS